MSHHRTLILCALVLTVISVFFSLSRSSVRGDAKGAGEQRAPVGLVSVARQPLPAYRMVSVNRQEVIGDELSHGRVLLVYLTTSCKACLEEIGVISRLRERAPASLQVYGVGIERPAQVATFVKEVDLKFPMLVDVDAQLARSLDIHYFPSTFLIEDGVITKTWRGVTRDEADLYHQLDIQ